MKTKLWERSVAMFLCVVLLLSCTGIIISAVKTASAEEHSEDSFSSEIIEDMESSDSQEQKTMENVQDNSGDTNDSEDNEPVIENNGEKGNDLTTGDGQVKSELDLETTNDLENKEDLISDTDDKSNSGLPENNELTENTIEENLTEQLPDNDQIISCSDIENDLLLANSTITEKAIAFRDDVNALNNAVQAGDYEDNQYGLKQAILSLEIVYNSLDDSDKQSEIVAEQYNLLENILNGVYLHPDIEAFLSSGYEFLESHKTMEEEEFTQAVGELIDSAWEIANTYYMGDDFSDAQKNKDEFFNMLNKLYGLNHLLNIAVDMTDFLKGVGTGWYGSDMDIAVELLNGAWSCMNLSQLEANLYDFQSFLQTANGALNEIKAMLERMCKLCEYGMNSPYDNSNFNNLKSEVEELNDEIARVVETTNFNRIHILSENFTITEPYTGISLTIPDFADLCADLRDPLAFDEVYLTALKEDLEAVGKTISEVDSRIAAIEKTIESFDNYVEVIGVDDPGYIGFKSLADRVLEIKYKAAKAEFIEEAQRVKFDIGSGKYDYNISGLDFMYNDVARIFLEMLDEDKEALATILDELGDLVSEKRAAYREHQENFVYTPSSDAKEYITNVEAMVAKTQMEECYETPFALLVEIESVMDNVGKLTWEDRQTNIVKNAYDAAQARYDEIWERCLNKYETVCFGPSVENAVNILFSLYRDIISYIEHNKDYPTDWEQHNYAAEIGRRLTAIIEDYGIDLHSDAEFAPLLAQLREMDTEHWIFDRDASDYGEMNIVYPFAPEKESDAVLDAEYVYDEIGRQAEDFISCVQTMEGSFDEIHTIVQRINELCGHAINEPLTDKEIKEIAKEIEDVLISEIVRITESTAFNSWYGLLGGSVEFQIGWQQFMPDKDSIPTYVSIPDVRAMGQSLNTIPDLLRNRDGSCFDVISEFVNNIVGIRDELGAKQNAAEHIVLWADRCTENIISSSVTKSWEENPDSLGNKDYAFPSTNEKAVLGSTMNNCNNFISMVQLFEGALTEMHSILQRINEKATQCANSDITEKDKNRLDAEIDRLYNVITYMRLATSYYGYHGLYQNGTVTCPTGWADSCHNALMVSIPDLSNVEIMSVEPDEIDNQIEELSAVRALLGANQNLLEHIIGLCEYVLENGPMIGNKFTIDEETGHHIVVEATGAAYLEMRDMEKRIEQLEIKLQSPLLTDYERKYVQMEIDLLIDGYDVITDVISTRVAGSNYVRNYVRNNEDGTTWKNEIYVDTSDVHYDYRLLYTSTRSDTTNVCIIDYLENNDNSFWAGIPTGVTFDESIPIPDVYAILYNNEVPSEDLPDMLPVDNGEVWVKIDPQDFDDWPSVYALAFYFGNTVFGPELGVSEVAEVVVNMQLKYRGKTGSIQADMPTDGYKLYNTCMVRERVGDDNEIVSYNSETETVVIQRYDSTKTQMPSTGGSGATPIYVAGLLLIGAFVALETIGSAKKRKSKTLDK